MAHGEHGGHGGHGGHAEHGEHGHETGSRHKEWFERAMGKVSLLFPDLSRPGLLGLGLGVAVAAGFTGPVGTLLTMKGVEWAGKALEKKGKQSGGGGHDAHGGGGGGHH